MSVYAKRLTVEVLVNTNAVINTATNHVVLAAPAAGFRYRIYDIGVRKTDLAAAFLPAVGLVTYFSTNIFGMTKFSSVIPAETRFLSDVGIPQGNLGITGQSISSVANTPIGIWICYSIEQL